MSRGSSRRLMPEPKSVAMADLLGLRAGRGLDRGHDVLIAGAAAEIAFDGVSDLGLARLGIPGEQVHGGHDQAGSAEAALQPVLVPERLLQRMQPAVLAQPLDGPDLLALRLYGEDGAALDRVAVDQHGTRAALARVAADVRAREVELVAQHVREQRPRLDLGRAGRGV